MYHCLMSSSLFFFSVGFFPLRCVIFVSFSHWGIGMHSNALINRILRMRAWKSHGQAFYIHINLNSLQACWTVIVNYEWARERCKGMKRRKKTQSLGYNSIQFNRLFFSFMRTNHTIMSFSSSFFFFDIIIELKVAKKTWKYSQMNCECIKELMKWLVSCKGNCRFFFEIALFTSGFALYFSTLARFYQ